MSLGVAHGDTVTVSAVGSQAEAALEAFVELLDPREPGEMPEPQPVSSPTPAIRPIGPPEPGAILPARPASPGLASGRAFALAGQDILENVPPGSPAEERDRLDEALEGVRAHLDRLAGDDPGDAVGVEIAAAHRALMDDPQLLRSAQDAIHAGQSAAAAWRQATASAARALQRLDDPRLRERADDLEDVDLRVQRALAGEAPGEGPDLPEGTILVADNLLPSQLLEMDRTNLEGMVLSGGGATSHVAILAMSLGVPMLVAGGPSVLSIENGEPLLLDADLGELHFRPENATAEAFHRRLTDDARLRAEEKQRALEECLTRDGERIHILANIASAADAAAAAELGAEGCGLLRTEFLYMGRAVAPGVEEQRVIYQEIADALGDRPLVVRTLDAGGDKPIPYLEQPPEENPALGVRGIRLGLANPGLLQDQLRALLQVKHSRPLQLMIPMISSVGEVLAVRQLLQDLGWVPDQAQAAKLGVMIETPAAALIADRLASLVDFFSIGTNDLAQYTLCMDRGEPRLANGLDVLHPAVLMMIARAAKAAKEAGIAVAVCGGAAGDILAAPLLLGMGIRELSMPGSLVPRQKSRLRTLEIQRCVALAEQAVGMDSAVDVRELMRENLAAKPAA
jgi:phosphoenolpyruvate-protein phosphotransferase